MKEYFLTIRAHNVKVYVSEREIEDIVSELKARLDIHISDLTYEIDKKYNQLHSHLMIRSRKNVYYKDNSSIRGFRVYWKPICCSTDRSTVLLYIHKDSSNKYEQEQIIQTNYYNHHYGFNS